MRTLLIATAVLLLLGSPALAQAETETEALENDPAVRDSQLPPPSPQGTRAPEPEATDTDTGNLPLREALTRIWTAPTDLQGNPIEGPNPLATEPPAPAGPAGTCPPGETSASCPQGGTEMPR